MQYDLRVDLDLIVGFSESKIERRLQSGAFRDCRILKTDLESKRTTIAFSSTTSSSSAGFASNNWQIRANSSASGVGNFLAFVDQGTTGNSETGTIVLK